jgi:hypothetical protein
MCVCFISPWKLTWPQIYTTTLLSLSRRHWSTRACPTHLDIMLSFTPVQCIWACMVTSISDRDLIVQLCCLTLYCKDMCESIGTTTLPGIFYYFKKLMSKCANWASCAAIKFPWHIIYKHFKCLRQTTCIKLRLCLALFKINTCNIGRGLIDI